MENRKKSYEAPRLTVVGFKAERGYAASGPFELDEFLLWDNDQSTEQMESYTTGNGWNEGSNHFWD